MSGDHPVWASLRDLLEKHDGATIATKYLITKSDFTPFEFLSASAAQCFTIDKWPLRIELYKACLIAIRLGGVRVSGFCESIFNQLIQVSPYDETYCAELVELHAEAMVSYTSKDVATKQLLKLLFDPLLTRISNLALAKSKARKILSLLELDLAAFTLQEILLFPAFKEKSSAQLEDDSSDEDDSLSEYKNTSDSTNSDITVDLEVKACPLESTAAACYFMAPDLLDPPLLSNWGKFKYGQPSARFLLGNCPVKSLAAQRGFELFCSFDCAVVKNEEEVFEMLVAAISFCVQLQSLPCRNAIQEFVQRMDTRVQISLWKRVFQEYSLHSADNIRAWALDQLRALVTSRPMDFFTNKFVDAMISHIEANEYETASAALAMLRWMGLLFSACDHVALSKERIQTLVSTCKQCIAVEADFLDMYREPFLLRPSQGEDQVPVASAASACHNDATAADVGRARLISNSAQATIDTWTKHL